MKKKIKNKKNKQQQQQQKTERDNHFTQLYQKSCCIAPEIWHMTDVIVIFHLGYFLPFYPANNPNNQNF